MQMTNSLMSTQQLLETPRDVVYRVPVCPPNFRSPLRQMPIEQSAILVLLAPCLRMGLFHTDGTSYLTNLLSVDLGVIPNPNPFPVADRRAS